MEATNGTEAEARKRVTISIEEDVHKRGTEMARQDKRSFSHYLEWLIEEEAKRKAKANAQEAAA